MQFLLVFCIGLAAALDVRSPFRQPGKQVHELRLQNISDGPESSLHPIRIVEFEWRDESEQTGLRTIVKLEHYRKDELVKTTQQLVLGPKGDTLSLMLENRFPDDARVLVSCTVVSIKSLEAVGYGQANVTLAASKRGGFQMFHEGVPLQKLTTEEITRLVTRQLPAHETKVMELGLTVSNLNVMISINALGTSNIAPPISKNDLMVILEIPGHLSATDGDIFVSLGEHGWFNASVARETDAYSTVFHFTTIGLEKGKYDMNVALLKRNDFFSTSRKGSVHWQALSESGECDFDQADEYLTLPALDDFHSDEGLHLFAEKLTEIMQQTAEKRGRGEGLTIVDVGANVGQDVDKWFEMIKSAGDASESVIVMFEPDQRATAQLQRQIDSSCANYPALCKTTKLVVSELGISNASSKAKLYQNEGETVFSTILPPVFQKLINPSIPINTNAATAVDIKVTTLDEYFFGGEYLGRETAAKIQRRGIDVLKIDTEGGERRVIAGAKLTLARTRMVLLECSSLVSVDTDKLKYRRWDYADPRVPMGGFLGLTNDLDAHGFDLYKVRKNGKPMKLTGSCWNDVFEETIFWSNCVALPRERFTAERDSPFDMGLVYEEMFGSPSASPSCSIVNAPCNTASISLPTN